MKTYFRKADILLLAALLLLGGLSVVFVHCTSGRAQTVELSVNGELWGVYPLSEQRRITVETEYGRNVVEISGGTVSVTESDCNGQDCLRFGKIENSGQVIMCLPHRLIISIRGGADINGENNEVDAVVY